jgi:hypothetical protein
MRTQKEVDEVLALVAQGLNNCEISRRTGIPRTTVRWWRDGRIPGTVARNRRADCCQSCGHPPHDFEGFHSAGYAYLLGMYLGDGYIVASRRGVYRLSIYCDTRYPRIVEEIAGTLLTFTPSRHVSVEYFPDGSRGRVCRVGAYSKAWPCLFPQHGPGRKHTRPIVLEPWQRGLVDAAPEALLRGLLHSDGCRSLNRIRGRDRWYEYPRYTFCNVSDDIRGIFCEACDQLGIPWRRMNARNISVARREGVARLDEFVGPKS